LQVGMMLGVKMRAGVNAMMMAGVTPGLRLTLAGKQAGGDRGEFRAAHL
jgi:hypothetical protein